MIYSHHSFSNFRLLTNSKMGKKLRLSIFVSLFLLISHSLPISAQTPALPIYIVQPGDTLYTIAVQFNTTIADIVAVNEFENPDWLSEGDAVRIPGYEGVSGEFIPYTVQLDDSFDSILQTNHLDETLFTRINHIISPTEIIAGKNIILPVQTQNEENPTSVSLDLQSPFLQNSLLDQSVWENDFDTLIASLLNKNAISIQNLTINPFPIQQGQTSMIHFESIPGQKLQFMIDNAIIPVYEYESGKYFAMYGINATSNVGRRELILGKIDEDSFTPIFSQSVHAVASVFATDPVIIVAEEYIDPTNTLPEEEAFFSIASNFTNRDLWDGSFSYPVDDPCFGAFYGSSRSYNNGPFDSFHTGVDFSVCAPNLNIYAAGSGRVVFAGQWFVRGNSVVIDHGWGVYTGYWHMSEIKVQAGDVIEEGQLIGIIGSTGRSTGPHLHWELLVNDIQVNPLQWLDITIP